MAAETAGLRFSPLQHSDGADWRAFLALYRDSFPETEREPEAVIAERVRAGRYALTLARLEDGRLAGFHLIDRVPDPAYALLCFLAVTPELRGRGLGTAITRHAFGHFATPRIRWLLLEARERQARLYGRLGARRLMLDYAVPHFTDDGSTPMHLMALAEPDTPGAVGRDFLCRIIEHVFTDGYGLRADDPRLRAQCARVPERVTLRAWPPD